MADIELLEGEEWRPVVGYEGMYEVSNMGRVRSLERKILGKDGVVKRFHGRLLKPWRHNIKGATNTSYLCVHLGAGNNSLIHVLVADAFIGERPNGYDVMHINGVRSDNKASNLKYGSRAENQIDMYSYGVTHAKGKLSIDDVLQIKRKLAMGVRSKELQEQYGVSRPTISAIKTGRSYKWLKEGEDFAT